jgi:hypothetical protein
LRPCKPQPFLSNETIYVVTRYPQFSYPKVLGPASLEAGSVHASARDIAVFNGLVDTGDFTWEGRTPPIHLRTPHVVRSHRLNNI